MLDDTLSAVDAHVMLYITHFLVHSFCVALYTIHIDDGDDDDDDVMNEWQRSDYI
jgi:hypothetical protein